MRRERERERSIGFCSSPTTIMIGALYSSVGRAGDCNVTRASLGRWFESSWRDFVKQNQIWLSGRVVYGASLRHWSLRRRGFKSRLSQNIECISFWMDETLTDRAGCPLKCSLVPFLLTRCRWNAHPQPPEQRRTSMSIAPSSQLSLPK